jgi:hypothetical protein
MCPEENCGNIASVKIYAHPYTHCLCPCVCLPLLCMICIVFDMAHPQNHKLLTNNIYMYIYIYIYIVISSQVLYSRWKFITLTVQYTTVEYSSQLFYNSNTRITSTGYSEYFYCLLASALVP